MAEGNLYIDSKPRASVNKCCMSLYCINIDVYFDNMDVYFQKCFDRRDMHNDNERHQDFWKLALREWAVFTKENRCWDSEQYFSPCTGWTYSTFFHYRDKSFEVCRLICHWLILAFVPTLSYVFCL